MAAENYRKFLRHLLLMAVFVACVTITCCSSTPQPLDKTDLSQKVQQPIIQQSDSSNQENHFIDVTEISTPQEEEEETTTQAGEDLSGSEFFLKKLLFKKFAFGGFHGGFRKRGFGHGGGYCCGGGGGYGHHGGFGGGYGHGGGYGGGFGHHGGGFYGGGYKKGFWG